MGGPGVHRECFGCSFKPIQTKTRVPEPNQMQAFLICWPERQNIQMWTYQLFFGDTSTYFSDKNNLKKYVSDIWSIVPLPNYRNLIFSRLVAVTVSFGIWDRLWSVVLPPLWRILSVELTVSCQLPSLQIVLQLLCFQFRLVSTNQLNVS